MNLDVNNLNKNLCYIKNNLLSDEFVNYVKNKKIAIVGPSPELIDKKLGSEIDSYDIVVKINNGYKLNHIDYGKKIDIIYLNLLLQKSINNVYNKLDNIKFIKLISQDFNKNKFDKNSGFNTFSDFLQNNYILNSKHNLLEYAPLNTYNKLFNIKNNFLGGIVAILEIIAAQPEILSIYGFDFYYKLKNNSNPKLTDIWPSYYQNDDYINYSKDQLHSHKDNDLSNINLLKFILDNIDNIEHLKNTKIIITDNLKNIISKYT